MSTNKENKSFWVIAQCFYGNRTSVQVNSDNIDGFILGFTSRYISSPRGDKIMDCLEGQTVDRTIIKIPGTSCAIVYSEIQDKEWVERYTNDIIEAPVYAAIPELGLKIHSRCFVCGINEDGTLCDFNKEDSDVVFKYLT